jgi:glyoxylase-like metal-dependent hydrolase (beta-lactamase superfamily II)
MDDASDLAGQPIALERIDDFVYRATGLSNVYLVKTDEGDVVIDTGFVMIAAQQKAVLSEISSGPASYIILTHAHGDHVTGTALWRGEDTRVIAHSEFPQRMAMQKRLTPYFNKRNHFFYPYAPTELPPN